MENTKILSHKNIIAFILIIAVIFLSIYTLDILMMLFGSFVITCAISPIINKMEKRIPRVSQNKRIPCLLKILFS